VLLSNKQRHSSPISQCHSSIRINTMQSGTLRSLATDTTAYVNIEMQTASNRNSNEPINGLSSRGTSSANTSASFTSGLSCLRRIWLDLHFRILTSIWTLACCSPILRVDGSSTCSILSIETRTGRSSRDPFSPHVPSPSGI
jgi:hypothetical protein